MNILKTILLMFVMVVSFSGYAYADEDVQVRVDGISLDSDVAPIIINDRTMVPLRTIFEELGLNVQWDEKNKTVIGTKDNIRIELSINNATAKKNGQIIYLNTPAIIIDGRTMVPLRFIAESLECTVTWSSATNSVIINTKQLTYQADNLIQVIKGMWVQVDTMTDEYDQYGIPVIELTDTEFKCGWYASEWDTIWEYSIESIDVNLNTVKIQVVKEDYTKEIFTLHLDTVGEKNYLTVLDEAGNETSWSPCLN
ncbi:MAG: hypothetical protein H6Q64_913 [Firmicutes bacterium]|nr:hypothetical protein [Bacillota bacterium]